jgi:hypothetical protein
MGAVTEDSGDRNQDRKNAHGERHRSHGCVVGAVFGVFL